MHTDDVNFLLAYSLSDLCISLKSAYKNVLKTEDRHTSHKTLQICNNILMNEHADEELVKEATLSVFGHSDQDREKFFINLSEEASKLSRLRSAEQVIRRLECRWDELFGTSTSTRPLIERTSEDIRNLYKI